MDKTQTGLAGEYFTLAQLTQLGFVATLTLGNTKGVDILVSNQELNTFYKVEMKTSTSKPHREKAFGEGYFHSWTLGKKNENIKDPNMLYCFVKLRGIDELPLFFIVQSKVVAEYVKWQHEHWLSSGENRKDTSMRKFRIPVEDPDKHQNNWNLFNTSPV